ncbi:MAG TPA: hypothetical protein VM573_02065 [Actinomycetota bacterium]|jgi:ribosome-associated translation inhibitor RaiA|nr:hypothetical protein [Actinomycetota bacterium]
MRIRVSSPGQSLSEGDLDRIHQDLEKIDRRLAGRDEVDAEIRVNRDGSSEMVGVVLEVDYGRNHLVATSRGGDVNWCVRDAREEILRQINDRTRRGHSSFLKRR